jgi:hypothetical protein
MRLFLLYIVPSIVLILVSCNDREVTRLYYDSGKLHYEYEMKNGIRDGFAKIYSEDGTLEYEGDYKNDLRYGWHMSYYPHGNVNRKWLYENVNGKEKVIRKMKYNKEGNIVSDFTFALKRITLHIKNQMPYRVGDTLLAKMKIENPKYVYSETTIGHFDDYLNVQKYEDGELFYYEGNKDHEMVMRLHLTKPGPDTITWLVRDFDYFPKTDSTGASIGEESYCDYQIQVEER